MTKLPMLISTKSTSREQSQNTAAVAAVFLFVATIFTNLSHAPAYAQAPVVDRSTGAPATPAPATTPAPAPSTAPSTAPAAAKATPLVPSTVPTSTALTPVTATPATAAPLAPSNAPGTAKTFVTIGERAVVLYDAPSTRSNKTFILNRLTPLEVLVKLDRWTKVRDAEGAIGWVENAGLNEKRHVQVFVPLADVRSLPNATAGLVFEAQRNVVLEVTGVATADGWLPVRHRDGQSGFVRLAHIWGD